MQAFTIQTNGETKKGIRVERFEKTGAYQISVLKGRRPVFVPIFKRNQIVGEGPLGYQILEAGIWSDSQTGRVKLQNPKNDAWEASRNLVSLRVYFAEGAELEIAPPVDSASLPLAVAYDQMRNGRQYCDLVAVLKAGEKVRFIEHARMGVKVVKTLLTDENGIPQLVDGDVPEPAMMQALAEVAAATK